MSIGLLETEWSYILLVLPPGLRISFSPHNQQLLDTPIPTGIFHKALGSRCETLGVTGEHGGLTHIVETKVQHADSLQACEGDGLATLEIQIIFPPKNIFSFKGKKDYLFLTNASSTMRGSSITEWVDVGLYLL